MKSTKRKVLKKNEGSIFGILFLLTNHWNADFKTWLSMTIPHGSKVMKPRAQQDNSLKALSL